MRKHGATNKYIFVCTNATNPKKRAQLKRGFFYGGGVGLKSINFFVFFLNKCKSKSYYMQIFNIMKGYKQAPILYDYECHSINQKKPTYLDIYIYNH